MEQVLRRPIERLQEHRAIALVPSRQGDGLAGVLMIDMRRGVFRLVRAKVFSWPPVAGRPCTATTPRPATRRWMYCHGASCRAALRDMEMVQFHPTGRWQATTRG